MSDDKPNQIRKKRGAPRGVKRNSNNSSPVAENPQADEVTIIKKETMNDNQNETFYQDIGSEEPPVNNTPPTSEQLLNPPPLVTEQPPIIQMPYEDNSAPFVDPLISENVDTKPYAKGMDAQNIPLGDIPEATFKPPKSIIQDAAPKAPQQIPEAKKIEPLNAETNQMTDREKRSAAELTVASVWSGYEKLNHMMGNWLQMPVEKRLKLHNEKKIDLKMEVVASISGDVITVNEFYEQYNADVKEVFIVEQKMKDRLTEPMIREAMRRGLVMSDVQTILLGFGEDILTKGIQCVSIKRAMNDFTKNMMDEFARQRELTKKEREREEEESRLIDPESEEGARVMYEYFKKIRDMDISEEKKARMKSDLFQSDTPPAPKQEVREGRREKPATKAEKNREDIVVYEAEEVDDDISIDKEL